MTGDERSDMFRPDPTNDETMPLEPVREDANAPGTPRAGSNESETAESGVSWAQPATPRWGDWPPAPGVAPEPEVAPQPDLAPADPYRRVVFAGRSDLGATSAPRRQRGIGVGTVLAAALGAAVLTSALTFGAVELTRTEATPAPSAAVASPAASPSSATNAQAASVTVSTDDGIIAKVAAAAEPSVVTIATEGTTGFTPFSVPSSGVGSGIIVSSDGLILTNNHVVSGSSSLTVTLSDGKTIAGTVVATDPTKDLAVVRVSQTGLIAAKLATSAKLVVGQLAIAIGSPLGTFTDTVTQGIVSGLDRSIDVSGESGPRSVTHLTGLIQTDAAINPGNSGGPLLDSSGEVVGIVTAQASDAQGVGFAIPISAAMALIAQAKG